MRKFVALLAAVFAVSTSVNVFATDKPKADAKPAPVKIEAKPAAKAEAKHAAKAEAKAEVKAEAKTEVKAKKVKKAEKAEKKPM